MGTNSRVIMVISVGCNGLIDCCTLKPCCAAFEAPCLTNGLCLPNKYMSKFLLDIACNLARPRNLIAPNLWPNKRVDEKKPANKFDHLGQDVYLRHVSHSTSPVFVIVLTTKLIVENGISGILSPVLHIRLNWLMSTARQLIENCLLR